MAATPSEAQRVFLAEASKLPHFGSRLFALESISDKRVRGPCTLCISREGLSFLHPVRAPLASERERERERER